MTIPSDPPSVTGDGGKGTTVLVVTLGVEYTAPARMPRELKRAGFNVAVLAPKGAICTRTRFADSVHVMPAEQTLPQWIEALADLARSVEARLLLPGDDVTVYVLMQLVREPLLGLRPGLQIELASLIRRSLGDPAGYLDSVDKGRLLRRARALGLPVAPGDGVVNAAEAERVAGAVGYPVIVRPTTSSASKGVSICANAAELRAAIASLPEPSELLPPGPSRALVQRVIRGQPVNRPALSWEGREVCGFCRARLQPPPDVHAAGSVTRYIGHRDISAMNRKLLQDLGVSGFVGTEYLVDAETGTPYLIEINRRMVPASHTGSRVGVDLAAALAAIMNSGTWTGPTDLPVDNERTLALFPQEWLRDPSSLDLERLPTDAPWDDPELFEAMLALRARKKP
jgi:predicted ATP-grasp superfamily ATP-dependent carboligase